MCVAAVLLVTSTVAASGWSSLQGDVYNTGVGDHEIPDEEPVEAWLHSPEGSVVSSPTVVDGYVYFGAFDDDYMEVYDEMVSGGHGGEVRTTGTIYSLSVDDGEPRWRFDVEAPIWSTPAVVDGTVFASALDGVVYALDSETGDVVWTTDVGGPLFTSPTVDDGTVYVGGSNLEDHALSHEEYPVVALDAENGEEMWRRNLEEGTFTTPAVRDGVLYVGSQNGTMHALDAVDGSTVWNHSAEGEPHPDPLVRYAGVTSSATVDDEAVYYGDYAGGFRALDAATGDVLWETSFELQFGSSASVAGEVLYVGNYDGTLYALDGSDGDVLWRHDTGSRITKSSPLVSDGKVLVGSHDALHAVDAEDGEPLWRYDLASRVLSSPAVTEAGVFLSELDGVHRLVSADAYEGPRDERAVDERDESSGERLEGSLDDERGVRGWSRDNLGVSPELAFVIGFPIAWVVGLIAYGSYRRMG